MNSKQKIRFAVVGCGGISKAHFRGIAATEAAELVAVCDVNEERAKEIAAEYGARAYTDYEELVRQQDIDVINICTPSGMHPEQTVLAAKAGKHVICEKPIALDLVEINRMIEACRVHGVKLATIFPRRMYPAAQFVKRLLEEGKLGKLSLCSGYVKFYRNQAYYDSAGWRGTWTMDGGGAMMNQGIHTIDLLQWLVGPVETLFGFADHILRDIEVEDTAVVSLKFKSGALGSIEATTTSYKHPDHQIVIHGDKGTVILTGNQITSLAIVDEEIEIPSFEADSKVDGHTELIRDMVEAIHHNRDPFITGEDGRHSLEIILGTYESSRTGQPIKI